MRHARSRRTGAPSRTQPAAAEGQGTIVIESIAAGGDGVGRLDGLVCFTPRTAPGDRAQVAYVPHARLARGRVLQLLERSALRTEPRCHHYVDDRCGGCQLQHLGVNAQREARRGIVRDALRRIGRRDTELPTLVSGAEWEYRGRLTLTLLRRGRGWVGGLHAYDDSARVFQLTECPISHPSLVGTWRVVMGMASGLPEAQSLRVALRLADESLNSASVSVLIHGGPAWPNASEWGSELRRLQSLVSAVWWVPEAGERAQRISGAASATLPEESFAVAFEGDRGQRAPSTDGHVDDLAPLGNEALDAFAFAQVNREVASALRAYVLQAVGAFQPTSAIDGYSGTGILAEALARAGVRVTAIESDPAATARARERLLEFATARVLTDKMERGIIAALPSDVVVLNPPRRGLDDGVTGALAGAGHSVRAIVYVSCDPATLARDLLRLPRWRIESIRCFDMFPQTAHVETVVVLCPELS